MPTRLCRKQAESPQKPLWEGILVTMGARSTQEDRGRHKCLLGTLHHLCLQEPEDKTVVNAPKHPGSSLETRRPYRTPPPPAGQPGEAGTQPPIPRGHFTPVLPLQPSGRDLAAGHVCYREMSRLPSHREGTAVAF